ncbi:MAG: carboxypeptidase regulatory-like domain-containing protein [Acidobacteriaceae bacterium]
MKLISQFALFAAVALPVSLSAATISGTVTDRTTNKPAAGDTAVLLDLQQGMQESARTTIDAKGHYSFSVPDNAGMHLVQVEHQKASYYGPVPPSTSVVNIDVFDVVPKVDGLHLYADVSRMETDPQGLSVTESYFIRNESKPPKTQLSTHSFEFYLPQDAVLEGATATGPGGMAVSNSPVPMGDPGHYAFIFPLRPGETRFQIGYRIPYTGSATLHARVTLPAENIAVMLPKSMNFDGGKSFQVLGGEASGPGTQTWLATNVPPETPVAFTVSGTGSMPREQQNPQGGENQGMGQGGPGMPTDQGAPGGQDQPGAQSGGPGGGVAGAVPIGTPDPLQKYKWYILSGLGLALVIAAAFLLRSKPGQATAPVAAEPSPLTPTLPPGVRATAYRAQAAPAVATNGAPQKAGTTSGTLHTSASTAGAPGTPMLAALKEELFQLETERLEGKISNAEYAEHKAALEVLLKRALAREAVKR